MPSEQSPDDVRVTGLFSYPIKGTRAVDHQTALIETTGVTGDREWMLVDTRAAPASFISQREHPLLAAIRSRLTDSGLEVSLDNGLSLRVKEPTADRLIKVRVWNHETVAIDAGDEAAAWFEKQISLPHGSVRLVRFHREMRRDCNPFYAGGSGAHTYFADGYPILVTSAASLDDLNDRIASGGNGDSNALPMNRFRPNLVISGLPAWDEDHVDTLSAGSMILQLVKPCVRCQVTTTDQASGTVQSDEPLNTLARLRNNPDLGGVTFGWNAVVLHGGTVSTGDALTVGYRF